MELDGPCLQEAAGPSNLAEKTWHFINELLTRDAFLGILVNLNESWEFQIF